MMPEGLSPAWVLVGSVVGRQAASAVGMIGSCLCCCWLLAPRYRVSRAVNWVGHVIIHQTEMTKDTARLACMVRSVDDCVHLLDLLAPESADIGNDRPPPYLHVIALIRNFYCCLILPQLLLHPSTGRLSTFLRLAKRCRGRKK